VITQRVFCQHFHFWISLISLILPSILLLNFSWSISWVGVALPKTRAIKGASLEGNYPATAGIRASKFLTR
jgi:hypothetical protein